MKTVFTMFGINVLLLFSLNAMAGSQIKNVKITNKSINANAINAAIGSGSTANLGSVHIKGSKVSNMNINHKSVNTNTINAAIGGGTSNSGSISIK